MQSGAIVIILCRKDNTQSISIKGGGGLCSPSFQLFPAIPSSVSSSICICSQLVLVYHCCCCCCRCCYCYCSCFFFSCLPFCKRAQTITKRHTLIKVENQFMALVAPLMIVPPTLPPTLLILVNSSKWVSSSHALLLTANSPPSPASRLSSPIRISCSFSLLFSFYSKKLRNDCCCCTLLFVFFVGVTFGWKRLKINDESTFKW